MGLKKNSKIDQLCTYIILLTNLWHYICVNCRASENTSAQAQISLSCVNYSVSSVQISTVARTSLIFTYIFSNRVKQRQVRVSKKQQPHAQQGCAAALCALSSVLARDGVLLTWSRLWIFCGWRPRLTPALLWLVIFQPPHVGREP